MPIYLNIWAKHISITHIHTARSKYWEKNGIQIHTPHINLWESWIRKKKWIANGFYCCCCCCCNTYVCMRNVQKMLIAGQKRQFISLVSHETARIWIPSIQCAHTQQHSLSLYVWFHWIPSISQEFSYNHNNNNNYNAVSVHVTNI